MLKPAKSWLTLNGHTELAKEVAFSPDSQLTFRGLSRQFPGLFQRAAQSATPSRRSAGPDPGGVGYAIP